MTAYLVLASPGAQTPDEKSVVIADRFALLAFIAPVIWLLFNRLWLEAFAAGLITLGASTLASTTDQTLPALAIGLALQLITGLEGRNWRAAALQRRGWRLVDVIETDDADVAFQIHAMHAQAKPATPEPEVNWPSRPALKLGRRVGSEPASIGLVPVERN